MKVKLKASLIDPPCHCVHHIITTQVSSCYIVCHSYHWLTYIHVLHSDLNESMQYSVNCTMHMSVKPSCDFLCEVGMIPLLIISVWNILEEQNQTTIFGLLKVLASMDHHAVAIFWNDGKNLVLTPWTNYSHGTESFLRSWQILSYSNFPCFMEHEGSLPHSQEPATCPPPKQDRSSPCTSISLL